MASDVIYLHGPEDLLALISKKDFDFSMLERAQCGEGFNLDIRITGDAWGGKLDAKTGLFVFLLQKDIFQLYKNITGEHLSLKSKKEIVGDVLIEADLLQGSSFIKIGLGKVATRLVKKMNGNQITILGVTLILAWFAKDFLVSYNDRIINTNQIDRLVESNNALIEVNREAVSGSLKIAHETNKALAETTNSFRTLLKYTDDQNDQISYAVQGRQETVSAYTVKSRLPLPVPEEPKVSTLRGWADFSITRQNHIARTCHMTSPGLPPLKKAEISLDGGQGPSDDFFMDIARQLAAGKIPTLRLEVLLRVSDTNKIASATIISQFPIEDIAPGGLKTLQEVYADRLDRVDSEKADDRLF